MPLLFVCWSNVATAGRGAPCTALLLDAAPAFDRELELNAKLLAVTFKGAVFSVTPHEYQFLQLLIQAPNEALTMDELITGMWGENEPNTAESTIRVMTMRLRTKFKRVDPHFDKIRSQYRAGLYWRRAHHQKTVKGRVAVADHVYEGYADGQTIVLAPNLHDLLTAFIKRQVVHSDTLGPRTAISFKVAVSRLNVKFESILGVSLITAGPFETGTYQLNKALWDD